MQPDFSNLDFVIHGLTFNETSRSLVMKKKFRIAVIVFSLPVFFWESVERGINAAKHDLAPLGVTVS